VPEAARVAVSVDGGVAVEEAAGALDSVVAAVTSLFLPPPRSPWLLEGALPSIPHPSLWINDIERPLYTEFSQGTHPLRAVPMDPHAHRWVDSALFVRPLGEVDCRIRIL
jgi:hypothetical protein